MSYLEKFARNRRKSEDTKVLTARLPKTMYDDLQEHCENLGLSLSEAIYFLVEQELTSMPKNEIRSFTENTDCKEDEYKVNTKEDKKNTSEYKANTETSEVTTKAIKKNTKRFTVKPFLVGSDLPCPICESWLNNKNFARHVKNKHQMTTETIFDQNKSKVAEMIETKKAVQAN